VCTVTPFPSPGVDVETAWPPISNTPVEKVSVESCVDVRRELLAQAYDTADFWKFEYSGC